MTRQEQRIARRREILRRRRANRLRMLAGFSALVLVVIAAVSVASALDKAETGTADPLPSAQSDSRAVPEIEPISVEDKLANIKAQFPDGKYWNHMGADASGGQDPHLVVTDAPCDHSAYGDTYCNRYNGATRELFPQYDYLTQCLGFSSMVSDLIFGEDAPVTVFRNYDDLRVGDQIRLTSDHHSMIVTEKTDSHVTVCEVNLDGSHCLISWGRTLTKESLTAYGEGIEYITRYE